MPRSPATTEGLTNAPITASHSRDRLKHNIQLAPHWSASHPRTRLRHHLRANSTHSPKLLTSTKPSRAPLLTSSESSSTIGPQHTPLSTTCRTCTTRAHRRVARVTHMSSHMSTVMHTTTRPHYPHVTPMCTVICPPCIPHMSSHMPSIYATHVKVMHT